MLFFSSLHVIINLIGRDYFFMSKIKIKDPLSGVLVYAHDLEHANRIREYIEEYNKQNDGGKSRKSK